MVYIAVFFSKLALNGVFIRSMYFPEISVSSARKVCQNERKRKGGKALICRTLPPNLLIFSILLCRFNRGLCSSKSCDWNAEWRA